MKNMKRKTQSPNKSLKRKSPQKNNLCVLCKKSFNSGLSLNNSLFRKYSIGQMNYYYLSIFNEKNKNQQAMRKIQGEQTQENLQKYYRTMNRKHVFPKVKQVYKLHKQIPKILHPIITQIMQKCYHRKRLLQYFKIAKILGIKVESVKLSTFLLSISGTKKQQYNIQNNYDKLITKISTYDFSSQFQKQLLRDLNFQSQNQNKQNHPLNILRSDKSLNKPFRVTNLKLIKK